MYAGLPELASPPRPVIRSRAVKAVLDNDQIRSLADRCVQCGLCLPHCPTYRAEQHEGESPRGRIVLAKALAGEPSIALVAAAKTSLDHCLGCRACEAACPAEVEFGRLLIAGRGRVAQHFPPRLRARFLLWLIEHPAWLKIAMSFAGRWPGPTWLRIRVPAPHSGWHAVAGDPRGSVALFTGCIATYLDSAAHAAAIRCLNRRGWNVYVLPGDACCGSLHDHAGLPNRAEHFRHKLRQELPAGATFTALVGCSSGCIEGARTACAPLPVSDLMSFLDQQDEATTSHPSNSVPVLMHVPCTLRNVLKQPTAGQATLRRAGVTEITELPAGCCGAGGWNSWLDPSRSEAVFAPLREWLSKQSPSNLLSHNIGCRLHLQRQLGPTHAVLHPIELLDQRDQARE